MNVILSKRSINWKKTIFISPKQENNNSLNNDQKSKKQLVLLFIKKDTRKFGCIMHDYDFYCFKGLE